jgi:hypothetical protein
MNVFLLLVVAMFIVLAIVGAVILCLPTKILGDLQNWVSGSAKSEELSKSTSITNKEE